jgi:hypothetical protein
MKEFIDFFNNLDIKKPSIDKHLEIQKYFDKYFESHDYSTSRMSFLDLYCQEKYFYTIVDDTFLYFNLSIYKRKKGGSITLSSAPINKNGDINKEKDIIDYLSNHGVNIIISEEDMERYNYSDWKYLSTFDDYIASSEKLIELKGKDFKKLRWRKNQYEKQLNINLMENLFITNPSNNTISKSLDLLDHWLNRWKNNNNRIWEDPSAYIKRYHKDINNLDLFQYLSIHDVQSEQQLVYELTEKISNDHILSTTGYRHYDYNLLPEANEMILLRGIDNWYNKIGNHFLINLGYCGFNGKLKKQKMKYKPIKVLKHYKKESDTSLIMKNFDKFKLLKDLKLKITNPRLKSTWRK